VVHSMALEPQLILTVCMSHSCVSLCPSFAVASRPNDVFLAYFPFFEKIKGDLLDHLAVSVSGYPP
jgi:hypothetical protein